MKTDYDATDDILALHFTDKLVSQAGSVARLESEYCLCRCGSIVEIVIPDAKASGAWPIPQHAA